MKHLMSDLIEFHDAGQVPRYVMPFVADNDRVELRIRLIREESEETINALRKLINFKFTNVKSDKTICEVADGLADLIYVAVGTALELGIPLDRVWDEVHRSNMEKFRYDLIKREDGKILKPPNWKPPNIEKAIFGPTYHKSSERLEDNEKT